MNIVDRVKKIILSPTAEWQAIKLESTTIGAMYTGYVMILAAIPAVAGFIGQVFIGYSVLGSHYRMSVGAGLGAAILQYVLSLVFVYILALVIDALAPNFGALKDKTASMKVAAYSYTAAGVAGIFQIIPVIGILGTLAGLYSLYLFWVGLKIVKEPPQEKMLGYYLVSIVIMIVLTFVASAIVGAIFVGGSMMG